MKLLLNVGLNRNDGQPSNSILRTVAALNSAGFLLESGEIVTVQHALGEESTLSGHFRYMAVRPSLALHNVCAALAQDCIASAQFDVFGKLEGELIGPKSSQWGEFNPAHFHIHHRKEYA